MIDLPAQIEKIIMNQNLTENESYHLMKEILAGRISSLHIASLLIALRCKGESTDEIVGFVKAMREAMVQITPQASIVVDTCGTGGDGKGTFNISTASALVVAGAGYTVAKHGNRSVSSACGSADVLEALGVNVEMSKETAEKCLNEIGITFLYAPHYHPAMKYVGPTRKEMGIRTIFNILGPLVNPAKANIQIVGVPKKELLGTLSEVFKKLNTGQSAVSMVVHEDGYDEIVLTGKGKFTLIKDDNIKSKNFSLSLLGLNQIDPAILKGGNVQSNANLLKQLLQEKNHPLRDVVLANAALAIYCAKLMGSPKKRESIPACFENAKDSLLSGKALNKLKQLAEWSHMS